MKDDERRVAPVNTKRYENTVNRDRYRFDRVFVEDIPQDWSTQHADVTVGESKLRWQYQNKCPILIDEDGVIAKKDADDEEAQNQAYFALSILADAGYVSRFTKV